jgi:hypothetical protein
MITTSFYRHPLIDSYADGLLEGEQFTGLTQQPPGADLQLVRPRQPCKNIVRNNYHNGYSPYFPNLPELNRMSRRTTFDGRDDATMLRPEMTLAEAYRRRAEISEAGQAIFIPGSSVDEFFEIDLVDPSEHRPNWYIVTMKRDDDHTTALNLPGEMMVRVK